MPRQPRQKAKGLVHHVVHRGINRQPVFRDAQDHTVFLRILAKAADKYAVKVLAYCLMGNHLHLMVEDANCTLSELMHCVNGFYTTQFNQRHRCEGALLRGRFYSNPVVGDRYELLLFRYIHLNPVKAGMVNSPDAYRWSSYRSYLGRADDFPVAHERLRKKLSEMGIPPQSMHAWLCASYASLDVPYEWDKQHLALQDGKTLALPDGRSPLLAYSLWQTKRGAGPDAAERQRDGLLVETCRQVARSYGVELYELAAPSRHDGRRGREARGAAMLRCRNEYRASYPELSTLFGLEVRSVGTLLTRARQSDCQQKTPVGEPVLKPRRD